MRILNILKDWTLNIIVFVGILASNAVFLVTQNYLLLLATIFVFAALYAIVLEARFFWITSGIKKAKKARMNRAHNKLKRKWRNGWR